MVSDALPTFEEKAAEMLSYIDSLTEIFPSISIRSIQIEAGVPNNTVARLRAGKGATYANVQRLDAYLQSKRQQLEAKGAAISTTPTH